VAVAGLVFDGDFDFGDAAGAGLVGAAVGANSRRNISGSTENLYDEHAVVDIYSKNNVLPHLAVDFISNRNSAKRFFAYIQNCIPDGSTE